MKIILAGQDLPSSGSKFIFLAGPTRRQLVPTETLDWGWRSEAVEELSRIGYDGHVFLPLTRTGIVVDGIAPKKLGKGRL